MGSEDAADVSNALNSIRSDLLGKRILDQSPYLNLANEDFSDSSLLKKVAKALQLPGDLLSLKVAHLRALEQVQESQRRFEEAVRNASKRD